MSAVATLVDDLVRQLSSNAPGKATIGIQSSVVPSGQPGRTVAAFLIAPLTVPAVFSAANP
jgi:hypothetical protein